MAPTAVKPGDSGWKKAGPAHKEKVQTWISFYPRAMAQPRAKRRQKFSWLFVRIAAKGDSHQSSGTRAGGQPWLCQHSRVNHASQWTEGTQVWATFAHWSRWVVSVWTVPSGEKSVTTLLITVRKCWENWNLYSGFGLLALDLWLADYMHHVELARKTQSP